MSAVDAVDHRFNTTSIPATGIYVPTADQFFCQMTKFDVRCVTSAQFATQPFDQLCPSGDCWTDCQDLERLYSPLPGKITFANQTAYGTPPNVTFWPLCAGLTNITQAIQDGVAPEAETARFRPYFTNDTQENLRGVAAATTHCWTDTCARARHPEACAAPCAAVNLLENRTTAQLAGTRECIRALCLNITGLPFGNQDIVGIGVTTSYVIQSLLIVLCWVALAVSGYFVRRHRRRSQQPRSSESRNSLLKSVSGFHAAQCYFSIPLAIAAFYTNPFTLDPLNAFGLLPVSINGFLPQIFTLMVMHYHHLGSWYPLILTNTSYFLNTIIFWAVITYLKGIKGRGTALHAAAYMSLGGIESCGGMTGIGICLPFQQDSPPAFLIQQYGRTAWIGIRLAPWIWAWCTICLLLLTFLIGNELRDRSHNTLNISYLANVNDWIHRTFRGTPAYGVMSVIFFAGIIYQAVMFYSFVSLGLVDLHTWSFGQIVAITVWVPPVVDYLHLTFNATVKKIHTRRPRNYSAPDLQPLSTADTSNSVVKNQGYGQAAEHDDDDTHSNSENIETATRPNEFQLQSRKTGDF